MTSILSSAAKIVFILMAVAVVVGMFMGRIDPKDFMVLASMAFAFYFVSPSDPTAGGVK